MYIDFPWFHNRICGIVYSICENIYNPYIMASLHFSPWNAVVFSSLYIRVLVTMGLFHFDKHNASVSNGLYKGIVYTVICVPYIVRKTWSFVRHNRRWVSDNGPRTDRPDFYTQYSIGECHVPPPFPIRAPTF